MYNQREQDLLPQGDRTSSDGREGTIVPGPLPSSSNDGPTSGCTAGMLAEDASAKTLAEKNERAGLPRVLIPPIDKEGRCKPGPAFTKIRESGPRTRSRSRSGSRSSSVVSVSSIRSGAIATVEETRKAQRELERDVRRCMAEAAITRAESYENMDIMIVSDDDGESCEERHSDSGSDTEYVEVQETSKREKKRKCKSQRSRAHSKPKKGRPPTTGEYVRLAEAKEALNAQKREEERMEREKKIRQLSSDDLLESMGIDMEEEIEDAKHGPTADLANRAREGMLEVLRVAKISSSIKGDLRKVLRNAAISATAVVEILRTRADCPADSDVPRQFKVMKEEMKQMKAEVARVNEEAKRLRQELAETKAETDFRELRKRRVYVKDSPTTSPGRELKDEEEKVRAVERAVDIPLPIDAEENIPMEIESGMGEAEQEKAPKYCDARRKKEILPPPEEWPAAVRPALQGKVKILRDAPLMGHRVRLVDERKGKEMMKERERKERTSSETKLAEEVRGGAQQLMDQLAPLLNK